jgi:hypothetical protein
MGNIKAAIEYLKTNKIDAKEAINVLAQSRLDQNEKNLVYCYCYPRPLPDYGLPDRIQEYRASHMIGENGNDSEIAFLLEACQTEQYGRFMKHIMHAFENPEIVHPIEGERTDTCCLCGKVLHEDTSWRQNFPLDSERHNLCFGSSDSSSVICVDCLIRLVKTIQIVNELDPGFLDWTKRGSYQEALSKVHPI